MNQEKLVSVVIPCYNCEKFVKDAIYSICNQTYKNLEILIADDCSTDSTYTILENIAKKDTRIKLYHNTENMKIVKTLNFLIENASGDYIARMDADDISAPERIKEQVDFLDNNSDYGICGTNAWHINAENKIIGKSLLPENSTEIQLAYNFYCVFYHPSVMIRSSLYKVNRYKEEYLYAEDFELWKRLLILTKGTNLSEKLLYYRVLRTSISNSSQTSNIQKQITTTLCTINDFSILKDIKNKIVLGKILNDRTLLIKNKKLWMKFCILIYLFYRLFEKFYCFMRNKKVMPR